MTRLGTIFDLENVEKEVEKLEDQVSQPGFWDNQQKASAVSQELADKKKEVDEWKDIKQKLLDLQDLAELALEEKNEKIEGDITDQYNSLKKEFDSLEFHVFFSGKYDKDNAIFAVHAGSGGTEAQDWAEMILRMLLRYCEAKGFSTEILDKSVGSEAGIKSVTVSVKGRYAYGYLKSEAGVHRLVRISPFDAEKMRHTSFCLVEVLPEIKDDVDIEIDPKDLRIDTFLAGGHGGQSVQTTYSAVRIVHLPTKITVSVQNERSQTQNKETAMKILKSKLLAKKEEEIEREKQKLRGEYSSAEWGNQIRSYVLHPYKMVKDHRTKYEENNPDNVLDGKIDGFVEEFLKWEKSNNV